MTRDVDIIMARLTRLEKQNRRLRQYVAFAFTVMLISLAIGGVQKFTHANESSPVDLMETPPVPSAPPSDGISPAQMMNMAPRVPKLLEAEQFILRDPNGRMRAVMSTQNNRVAFAMFDSAGNQRLVLDLEANGSPWVRLADPSGTVRASITHQKTDGVIIALSDANGKSRTMLGTRGGGEPYLSLMDGTMRERINVTTRNDGLPYIGLADSRANERLVLDLDDDEFARVTIRDGKRTRGVFGKTPIPRMKQGRVIPMPPAAAVFYDAKGDYEDSMP